MVYLFGFALFSPVVALTASVNFCELPQQMIACAVRFAAELVGLPPDHDGSGLCFPQILPTDSRINVAHPLSGLDMVGSKIRNISKKQLRAIFVLHDETYKGLIVSARISP